MTSTIKSNEDRSKSDQKAQKSQRVDLIHQKTPVANRQRLSENYEKSVSGRDSWWRMTIRETPVPGCYESPDFLHDIKRKHMTYSFRSDGRKLDPQPQIGKGDLLLPGAYEYEDLTKRAEKFRHTFGFKNSDRQSRDVLNFGRKDKDVNVPPNVYNTDKYLTLTVEKQPSKHPMFKSQSQRFPTIQFKPKEGPAPGNYQEKDVDTQKVVSSCFKSKTPRFPSSHTKVPGPGTYATSYKPMTTTITKMGRQYGLFFSPEFNTAV